MTLGNDWCNLKDGQVFDNLQIVIVQIPNFQIANLKQDKITNKTVIS